MSELNEPSALRFPTLVTRGGRVDGSTIQWMRPGLLAGWHTLTGVRRIHRSSLDRRRHRHVANRVINSTMLRLRMLLVNAVWRRMLRRSRPHAVGAAAVDVAAGNVHVTAAQSSLLALRWRKKIISFVEYFSCCERNCDCICTQINAIWNMLMGLPTSGTKWYWCNASPIWLKGAHTPVVTAAAYCTWRTDCQSSHLYCSDILVIKFSLFSFLIN